MLMSFCTTASSNLRPMRRLTANSVFCGLVTAWRLADWPTRTSLSLVNATMDGVVRSPSLFSMTRGLPLSMMATQELVVPRSMPITLPISNLHSLFLGIDPWPLSGDQVPAFKTNFSGLRCGNHDAGRPQQPPVQLVAALHDIQNGVRRRIAGLRHHGLVQLRVERSAFGIDLFDLRLLESLGELAQGRVLPFDETRDVGLRRVADGH